MPFALTIFYLINSVVFVTHTHLAEKILKCTNKQKCVFDVNDNWQLQLTSLRPFLECLLSVCQCLVFLCSCKKCVCKSAVRGDSWQIGLLAVLAGWLAVTSSLIEQLKKKKKLSLTKKKQHNGRASLSTAADINPLW